MAIELKDVEHLSGLARISISDNEKEVLRHDLEEILAYVSKIKDAVAELGAPEAGELRNVLREDTNPHEAGLHTEDLLNAASAREGDRLLVKKIL